MADNKVGEQGKVSALWIRKINGSSGCYSVKVKEIVFVEDIMWIKLVFTYRGSKRISDISEDWARVLCPFQLLFSNWEHSVESWEQATRNRRATVLYWGWGNGVWANYHSRHLASKPCFLSLLVPILIFCLSGLFVSMSFCQICLLLSLCITHCSSAACLSFACSLFLSPSLPATFQISQPYSLIPSHLGPSFAVCCCCEAHIRPHLWPIRPGGHGFSCLL